MAQLRQISPRPRSPRQLRPKRSLIQLLAEEVEQLESRKREARAVRDRHLLEMEMAQQEKAKSTEVVSVSSKPAAVDITKVVEIIEISLPEQTTEEPAAVEVAPSEPAVTKVTEKTEQTPTQPTPAPAPSEAKPTTTEAVIKPLIEAAKLAVIEVVKPIVESKPLPRSEPTILRPLNFFPDEPLILTAPKQTSTSLKRQSNYWSFDKEGSFWLCDKEGCLAADKSGPFYGQRCEHGVCVWKEYSVPQSAGLQVYI